MLIKLKSNPEALKKIFPLVVNLENKERCVAATFWPEARMTCLQSASRVVFKTQSKRNVGIWKMLPNYDLLFTNEENDLRACEMEQQHWR